MAIMKDVKLYWPKILGEPRDKFNPADGREWSMDLCLTDAQVAELAKVGVTVDKYIKDKNDERGKHFHYTRNELKRDGTPSKPITVYAEDGSAWPQDILIGNGTVADVMYAVQEITARPKNRYKPSVISIMIKTLVPYEGKGSDSFNFVKSDKPKIEEDWDE